MQAKHLEKLIASDYRLIAIESASAVRTIRDFQPLVRESKAVYTWEETTGLYRLEASHIHIPKTKTPEMVLNYIKQRKHFGIYLLVNFTDNMNNFEVLNTLDHIIHRSHHTKIIIFINDYHKYPHRILKNLLITQEPEIKEFTLFKELN